MNSVLIHRKESFRSIVESASCGTLPEIPPYLRLHKLATTGYSLPTVKFSFLTLPRLIGVFLVVFCVVALQKYALGHFNNYLMFAQPFHNLLLNKSIYGLHPDLYQDNYKYSPTFAWLMGPFHFLPVWLGVLGWALLNTGVLLLGVWRYLADEPDPTRQRRAVLLIVFAEALITAQNMQSNNFIIGAILLGLYYLRHERVWQAAFFFSLCFFFKFYGVGAAIFFLFYPRKVSFLLAMTTWTVLLGLAPLTLIPFANLLSEYREWLAVVVESKLGLLVSVPGILEMWLGVAKTDANLRIIEAVGVTLFLLPFARLKQWSDPVFQRKMIASFLLFVVIFNKMAESPTYVLAVMGVGLWWVTLPKKSGYAIALLTLVIVFTSLSPTDLFPKGARDWFSAYSIKAVPCVLVWLRLQWEIWMYGSGNVLETAQSGYSAMKPDDSLPSTTGLIR